MVKANCSRSIVRALSTKYLAWKCNEPRHQQQNQRQDQQREYLLPDNFSTNFSTNCSKPGSDQWRVSSREDGSAQSSGSMVAVAGVSIMSTGQGAWRRTSWVVLPRKNAASPLRWLAPIIIKSAPHCFAY